jgi:hypothetical protein
MGILCVVNCCGRSSRVGTCRFLLRSCPPTNSTNPPTIMVAPSSNTQANVPCQRRYGTRDLEYRLRRLMAASRGCSDLPNLHLLLRQRRHPQNAGHHPHSWTATAPLLFACFIAWAATDGIAQAGYAAAAFRGLRCHAAAVLRGLRCRHPNPNHCHTPHERCLHQHDNTRPQSALGLCLCQRATTG